MVEREITFRPATLDDCGVLAKLNHQLIQDEGHRNPMTIPQLEQRMRGLIEDEHRAVIFEQGGEVAAYALYCEGPEEIYLRQFFVGRNRRRQGVGRQALQLLRSQVWPATKRLTVQVLVANQGAIAFWRAMGYVDYALTLEITP